MGIGGGPKAYLKRSYTFKNRDMIRPRCGIFRHRKLRVYLLYYQAKWKQVSVGV